MIKSLLITAAAAAAAFTSFAEVASPLSILPVPGEEITSFSYVYVQYPGTITRNRDCNATLKFYKDGVEVAQELNSSKMVEYGIEGDAVGVSYVYNKENRGQGTFEPGEYRIFVPEGFMLSDDEPTAELDVTYILRKQPQVVVSPQEGFLEEFPARILLTFPDATALSVKKSPTGEFDDNALGFYCPEESINPAATVKDNTIEVTLSHEYTSPGRYTLRVPGGWITATVDGEERNLAARDYTWRILQFPIPDIYPPQGEVEAEDLGEIDIMLSMGYTFKSWWPQSVFCPTIYAADENFKHSDTPTAAYIMKEKVASGDTDATFSLPENVMLSAGNYQIVIRKSAFTVFNAKSDQEALDTELTYNFTVIDDSGVETISASDCLNVYSIQGIRIAGCTSAADLNALPAGLYIVNGKKIIK